MFAVLLLLDYFYEGNNAIVINNLIVIEMYKYNIRDIIILFFSIFYVIRKNVQSNNIKLAWNLDIYYQDNHTKNTK